VLLAHAFELEPSRAPLGPCPDIIDLFRLDKVVATSQNSNMIVYTPDDATPEPLNGLADLLADQEVLLSIHNAEAQLTWAWIARISPTF